MKPLKVLDLFSGIGGFSLGLERTCGFETVAFCEIEPFPRAVLKKHWPDVPCFEDVRKLGRKDIDGSIDVICGGYPCQPFSHAGQRKGSEDDRHLWPEVNRLLAEFRPTWFIGENVAGHICMGLDDVLSDLEGKGYTARTFVIPACALNAKHRRDRTWIVANCAIKGLEGQQRPVIEGSRNGFANSSQNVANTISRRQQGQRKFEQSINTEAAEDGQATGPFNGCIGSIWRIEPDVGRVANGVPRRVDRLKALGNAVVPQIPEIIGYAILEAEKEANLI